MFNFVIEPKITKEFLLFKNTEETYMSYYLGVPITKKLICSPLREDKHKTCSFFKGTSGRLYFKDFATGQCLTFEGVVMAKYNCTYHNALKIIASDFGYYKFNKKESSSKINIKPQPVFESQKETFIQAQIKDFSEAELKWWLSFGITSKTLSKYKIFSLQTVFLNGEIFAQSTQHSPIYGYYFGKKGNIEQWRIYFPKNKNTGYKFIGNCKANLLQGYKQLPKSGNILVITKSMKDCLVFAELGIAAIAPCSEHLFVSESVLEELKTRFKHIVVLYDTDLTGVRFMNKIRKTYPELLISMIPRKYQTKDISDFYQKYGKDETIKLIKNYINYIKYEKNIA